MLNSDPSDSSKDSRQRFDPSQYMDTDTLPDGTQPTSDTQPELERCDAGSPRYRERSHCPATGSGATGGRGRTPARGGKKESRGRGQAKTDSSAGEGNHSRDEREGEGPSKRGKHEHEHEQLIIQHPKCENSVRHRKGPRQHTGKRTRDPVIRSGQILRAQRLHV